jgi:putative inorganic carbon (HCO3(-)) transporter
MTRLDRAQAWTLGCAIALVPLYPGFITFTGVAFPGVSVVTLPLAIAVGALDLLLIAVWIWGLLRSPGATPPTLRPLAIWMVAATLACALGFDPRDGSIFLAVGIAGVIWHAAIYRFYPRPGVARAVWSAYLASGTLAAAAAVAMNLLRVPASLYRIANGRAVGTFVLPGELAGYLIFFIPIACALALTARERAPRMLAWSGVAIGSLAMVLSFSRTGWVGLAAGIAVAAGLRARGRGLVLGAALLGTVLALVLLLFNAHHNPSENYTRISIWQAAIGAIDRFPLTGVGPFGFSHIYPFVRMPDGDATAFHAHSLYLTFFAETGILGLLAFGWAIVTFWRAMGTPLALLPAAIAAGVAGALVQGLIDTVSVVIFGLLTPMLALGLASARAEEPPL